MSERSLALIGGGYWGKNLARNYHALGVLRTICDIDEQQLQLFREQYPEVALTTDLSEVFRDPTIKRVAIATWPAAHFSLARQALLAGKDVYVEKPLCLDVEEGSLLLRLAQEKGAILMVGHVLQYHPYVQRLKEIVAAGELGKVQYIVSNRLNLGKIRTVENAMWSLAPHDISVILSLCSNQLPEQVRCVGGTYLSKGVADTTLTTLRFPDNVRAHVYVSWLNPFKEQKLTVVGSSGMAVFDDTLPWEQKLCLYCEPVTWFEGRTPTSNSSAPTYIEVPQGEPLRAECSHFLECCEERKAPRTDGAEGLRVLAVLQAAQESLLDEGEERVPSLPGAGGQAEFFVHPSAVVDKGASVGEGCKVWHFSHIMGGSQVGSHCNIGQNVLVSPGVILGSNVKVQNNVSLYTGVCCEDDVFLGPSCVFTNVTNPRSAIVRKDEFKQTLVCRGATVGANATIVCGVELGAFCFVGAGAVVTRDVKPYALVMGNPARQVGWMSRHGQRLPLPASVEEGQTEEATCPVTGECYRLEGERLLCVNEKEIPQRTEEELEPVLVRR